MYEQFLTNYSAFNNEHIYGTASSHDYVILFIHLFVYYHLLKGLFIIVCKYFWASHKYTFHSLLSITHFLYIQYIDCALFHQIAFAENDKE